MKTLYNLEDFCFDLPLEPRELAFQPVLATIGDASGAVVARSAARCATLWTQRRLLVEKLRRFRTRRVVRGAA